MYKYDELDYDEFYEKLEAQEIFEKYSQEMHDLLINDNKDLFEFFKQKINQLEDEKKNLQLKLQEYRDKENELKYQQANYKQELKKQKLIELFDGRKTELYQAEFYWKMYEKCNKCNDDRKIDFKSPTGKEYIEHCTCLNNFKVYKVKKINANEISLQDEELNMKFYIQYRDRIGEYNICNISISGDDIYTNQEYNNINNQMLFISQEECQKYCDWLNSKIMKSVNKNGNM